MGKALKICGDSVAANGKMAVVNLPLKEKQTIGWQMIIIEKSVSCRGRGEWLKILE